MAFEYFDLKPIVAYNALLNFIISNRGAGKTYSGKQHILRRFKNKDEKFLFLKRTETEIEATADGFWDDVTTKKQVFKFQKNCFYIGDRSVEKNEDGDDEETITWKLFGYAAALSTTAKLKGISPQGVTTIIWDEFIAYDGRYLRDEGTRLLDVMETIGRMREDVRLYAFGNKNEDGYYPVLHDLGVPQTSNFLDNKIYRFKSGEVLVYSFTNTEYVKAKSQTKLGKVARGTSYFEKMIENKNESNFSDMVISKKPRHIRPLFTIISQNEAFNVYFARISKREPTALYIESSDRALKYTYTTDKTRPTNPKLGGNGFQMLYGYLTAGTVRFDNQSTAQKVIEAIISKRR